jgi:hypothetical protein
MNRPPALCRTSLQTVGDPTAEKPLGRYYWIGSGEPTRECINLAFGPTSMLSASYLNFDAPRPDVRHIGGPQLDGLISFFGMGTVLLQDAPRQLLFDKKL